ncbi:MAG TPA: hypothetical protein ENK82_02055 [Campylobacterales bacterium]|nr:hypothetical protein [Campylobacterales bacterium]HHS92107.1 hypothetical protein [Campylobacterales bacterium]
MDISILVTYAIFLLIALILLVNVFKVFLNLIRNDRNSMSVEEDPIVAEIRSEVDTQVRPHLKSLEGMYEKSGTEEKTLSSFVFSVVKDKLSSYLESHEENVHNEINRCCSEYESAECKESFCLEGSGISCSKV